LKIFDVGSCKYRVGMKASYIGKEGRRKERKGKERRERLDI
jgi:hypothetical protein